jgi:hypothetical protein
MNDRGIDYFMRRALEKEQMKIFDGEAFIKN